VHDDRIEHEGRNHRQADGSQQTRDATRKHRRAQPRFTKPHRRIHSMNRERRVYIPALESAVPHFLRGLQEIRCAVEFSAQSIDFVKFSHG
jgi:hypothetical protein